MVCWKSTNSGASWASIPNVPGTTGNSNMPSSAINTTYWTTKQANLAYATDIPDGTPRIQYNYYDYQTGSWGSPTDLCSILPPNYIHHANPSLAVSSDESYKTVHVAWDADDTYPGNRVLVHREGGFRGFPSIYSVLQYQSESKPSISGVSQDRAWMVYQSASGYGIWKRYYDGTYWSGYYGTWIGVGFNPQISVGSATAKYIWTNGAASPYQINLSSESLNKTGNELAYSRALNVLDPVTQSSIGLELAPGEILRKTKDVEPLALANTLNDSVVFGATELLDAGSTEDFVLPSDADTLIIPMAAYGISAEKLFSNGGGMVRLSIVNSRTGAVLASFGSTAGSAISDSSRVLSNLHVPVAPIMAAAKGAVLRVRPEFIGLRDDLRPTFSLGHIYRKPLNTLMFKVNADLQCNASLVAEPTSFELSQTYPNPFNPSTTIGYQLPTEVTVKLAVFDVLGRQVVELASGVQPAGYYSVKWDASSLASGIYYARFIVTDELGKVQFAKVNKLLLMK